MVQIYARGGDSVGITSRLLRGKPEKIGQVAAVAEGNDETGVRNSLHFREKPFLEERSGEPLI